MVAIVTRRISQLSEGADLLPSDLVAFQRGDGPAQKAAMASVLDFMRAYGLGVKGDPGGSAESIGFATDIEEMDLDGAALAGVTRFRTAGYHPTGKGRGAADYRRMGALEAVEFGEKVSADGVRLGLIETHRDPFMYGAYGFGALDDEAIQMWIAGGGVRTLPAGAQFTVSEQIQVLERGTKIEGPGEIRIAADLAETAAIRVLADDVEIVAINLTNPGEYQSADGGKNIGIEIAAHRCRVALGTVRGFQTGITNRPTGEFFDSKVLFVHVLDVIGSAKEDRADGICMWGARFHVLGCTVEAKEGHDARIGIHVEALATFEELPDTPEDNTQALIMFNIVRGSFRRGIVNEAMNDVVIAFNLLPGGYTWWGIAVVQGAKRTKVYGNIIHYDRDPADTSGAEWAPSYAAIRIANYSAGYAMTDIVVGQNDIIVTRGGGRAFSIGAVAGSTIVVHLEDNGMEALVETPYNAIGVTGPVQLHVRNRHIKGPFDKAVGGASPDIVFEGGEIEGITEGFVFRFDGATERAHVKGVRFRNCGRALEAFGGSKNVRLHDCDLDMLETGDQVYLTAVIDGQVSDVKFRQDATISAHNGQDIDLSNNRFLASAILASNNTVGLTMTGNSCAAGTGATSSVGSINRLIERNHGFVTSTELNPDLLTDIDSWLNTWGKHAGKRVTTTTHNDYIATGSDPDSPWKKIEDGSVVTPA